MSLTLFQRGETVNAELTIRTASGALVDPMTSVQITITDPSNTAVVLAEAMDKDSLGVYSYEYTSVSIATLGIYRIRYTLDDTGDITILDDFFRLVA